MSSYEFFWIGYRYFRFLKLHQIKSYSLGLKKEWLVWFKRSSTNNEGKLGCVVIKLWWMRSVGICLLSSYDDWKHGSIGGQSEKQIKASVTAVAGRHKRGLLSPPCHHLLSQVGSLSNYSISFICCTPSIPVFFFFFG